MSIVVPSVEQNHVDKSISVVLGVRTGLTCWTFPAGSVEVDSERREDIVPDWMVPSGVLEYVLTQASAGYGKYEILLVATTISIEDTDGTMVPLGR